jgi:hypothetical protein
MSKLNETRLYSMADANLKQLADDLENTIERDATDFATRNIGTPQLTAYEALIADFDATTTDVELKGAVSATVALKDATAENIKTAVRTVRSMAEQAYSTKGLYKTFGFEEMGRLSDNDLYRMARRVVRTATKRQADLAGQGFTPAQLTGLATLATQLDDQLDNIHDAETERDVETQGRVQKGNKLYKEVMRLASIGKSLFADTDEARYNDYVMLEKRGGEEENNTPPEGNK